MFTVLLPPGVNPMCTVLLPPGVNPVAVTQCIKLMSYLCTFVLFQCCILTTFHGGGHCLSAYAWGVSPCYLSSFCWFHTRENALLVSSPSYVHARTHQHKFPLPVCCWVSLFWNVYCSHTGWLSGAERNWMTWVLCSVSAVLLMLLVISVKVHLLPWLYH
jgi:hypothetical protein